MTYNIFSGTAPAMPKPSKGTEFIKFALSQASKDMREVLIPMEMPALAAHLTEVKFMYSDNSKRIRDASRYTSKKISLKLLFLSDIFLFPFVRQQFPVLA